MRFGRGFAPALLRCFCPLLALTVAPGCAMLNSFLDPTTVGSFPSEFRERGIRRVLTPRESPPGLANATEPTPDDLVAQYEEYRIGPGDQVAIVIEDLFAQGLPDQSVLEVSPTGYIRLPLLGSIKVNGLSEPELEQEIKSQLKESGQLPNPIVRIFVQLKRQRYYTIIGSVNAAGPYTITDPDTRLLDAIGVARDIDATVKRLYVIRRDEPNGKGETRPTPMPEMKNGNGKNGNGLVIPPPTDEEDQGTRASFFQGVGLASQEQPASSPKNGADRQALDDLISPPKRLAPTPNPDVKRDTEHPFRPLIIDPQSGTTVESTTEKPAPEPDRPAERTTAPPPKTPGFDWEKVPEFEIAQRVIEIDVAALKSGDPRYNIVLRNRDVINVPADTGVFYLMGEIQRPGVYAFGGREISMKQAVAISGGFTPLAWPQRCEIIRREPGTDKQITIPVNVDAIFAGLQDDVLLRDEDIINVGTHTVAPFLFVIRNSFRFTYGFGFVYDRNFADKDAYSSRANPENIQQARRAARGLNF